MIETSLVDGAESRGWDGIGVDVERGRQTDGGRKMGSGLFRARVVLRVREGSAKEQRDDSAMLTGNLLLEQGTAGDKHLRRMCCCVQLTRQLIVGGIAQSYVLGEKKVSILQQLPVRRYVFSQGPIDRGPPLPPPTKWVRGSGTCSRRSNEAICASNSWGRGNQWSRGRSGVSFSRLGAKLCGWR